MASGTASGDSRYRLDLSSGVSGTIINASMSVTKTGGTGFWTSNAQWWRIRIAGVDQDGSWTYDFRGSTPKTIGIATRSVNVGYGTFLVESWVNLDSGLGQAYAAEYVTIVNPATVPSTPGAPSFSEVTATGMRLSWSIPANGGAAIDQMLLRRFANADGTGPYVDYPNAGNVTTRVVNDLAPGTAYYWVVYAHNGVGYSNRSGITPTRTSARARVPKNGAYVPAVQVFAPKAAALVAAQVKVPKNGAYVDAI